MSMIRNDESEKASGKGDEEKQKEAPDDELMAEMYNNIGDTPPLWIANRKAEDGEIQSDEGWDKDSYRSRRTKRRNSIAVKAMRAVLTEEDRVIMEKVEEITRKQDRALRQVCKKGSRVSYTKVKKAVTSEEQLNQMLMNWSSDEECENREFDKKMAEFHVWKDKEAKTESKKKAKKQYMLMHSAYPRPHLPFSYLFHLLTSEC